MKPKLNLIKCLHVLCIIGEAGTAVGLAALVAVAPVLESMVRGGHAHVGIYAGHESINWSFRVRLPNGANNSIGVGATDPGVRITAGGAPGESYGGMSFGPLGLRSDKQAAPGALGNSGVPGVVIAQTEGMATFTEPEVAAQAVAAARWPFVVGVLGAGGSGLAILDLLRRMLRSARTGEVFTAANIRRVQAVGCLLIASGVLKLASGAWLVSRMAAFVLQHVPAGHAALDTSSPGDLSLLPGLLIVALAEVFRQGLVLKEETQLTV